MDNFGTASEIYIPTVVELEHARQLYVAYAPRDLFYRVASELIDLALVGKTGITIAEALAVLLQTWNAEYYQYHRFTLQHFEDIEDLLQTNLSNVLGFRSRDIAAASEADLSIIEKLFDSFERVLGPVGAAKSLHLLAPRFFPLWDRKIAKAYDCELGPVGTNGVNYRAFFLITMVQVRALSSAMTKEANLLKRIDEYNYGKHTKGWAV